MLLSIQYIMLGTWFDDGTQLSGGEWQRIALGRAFFKDAELYMFDEPSSALDPRSEDFILENYCKIIKGKITQFINKEIVYNHFNALKNSVIRAINLGNLSFETEFWESSGLLNCDSFSEWKEKQLENDISSIK